MIVNADVKSLEVVVAAELSKDPVLSKELIDKVDIHDANRVAFSLGEGKAGRLVAKTFKFRLIYGGSAYSYANDPAFQHVSKSQEYWQSVIEKYYTKYRGIAEWHKRLIKEAQTQGKIVIPSGRFYPIKPDYSRREPWPLTIIKNYPVQGFGADLVQLARLEVYRRIRQEKLPVKLIGTIHDSIFVDSPKELAEYIGKVLFESIEKVPELCEKTFKYKFSLPLTSEVQIGPNKKDMEELKFS